MISRIDDLRLADSLRADQLRDAVRGRTIGRQIIVLRETRSTNDFLAQMAGPSLAEGMVVFAERQTAGRGQHGRRWESAAGKGLWFSIFLLPDLALAESARLTGWLTSIISATIQEQFAIGCTVKLPNDLYIDGKKIAGVLVEMRARPGGGYNTIAGIGINVNQAVLDFPGELRNFAGSLAMALGADVDRQRLAVVLLKNLDATYQEFFPR